MPFKLIRLVGPGLLTMCVAGCGDDGGSNPSTPESEAGVDAAVSYTDADADADVTTTSTRTTTRTSTSSGSGVSSNQDGEDASTRNDASDEGETSDQESDDPDETTSSSTGTTATTTATGVTEIEDPTSEEVPRAEGTYWDQAYWRGHVQVIGETTSVAVQEGKLCISGNETGTVGFWYNVNQLEGAVEQPLLPVIDGVNVNIETAGDYELHFYAGNTLYCSGVVDETYSYFLWGSFRNCENLSSFYDAQTAFTTIRFTYLADGAFNVCLNRLDSGRDPDAGIPLPVDAGDIDSGTTEVDSGTADVDSGTTDVTDTTDSGDASVTEVPVVDASSPEDAAFDASAVDADAN
jgi:hypothetical protein